MPAERFFLACPYELNAQVTIEGEEFHHMVKVMRNQVGDKIELVNGKNQLALGEIVSISKREAELHILSLSEKKPSSSCILAQALLRASKLEWIIEKAVELNVKEIRLFPSINSEKDELKESQMERLLHLAQAALKQCGRLDLPSITLVPPIEAWSQEGVPCFFGDTDPEAPSLIELLPTLKQSSSSVIVIGPEKGLHSKEIEKLRSLNFKGISIASNTLRTETAAIAACALLDYLK